MSRIVLFILLLVSIKTYALHPVHVSVINMNYSSESGQIDYSLQVSGSDFQYIINALYGVQLSVESQDTLLTNQILAIEKYVNKKLNIICDEKLLKSKFAGFKVEKEFSRFFFKSQARPNQKEFEIKNTLMFETFEDHKNLLIFATKSQEKGFTFTKEKTKQTINL